MFKNLFSRALACFVFFAVVCGLVFTFVVTGIAQLAFPYQANGSIIEVDGKKYGSELIGQTFNDMDHMWGRIQSESVVEAPDGTLAIYSAPSNKTPAANEKLEGEDSLQAQVKERAEMIKKANPDADMDKVPVDLVTNSGSGLDPQISMAAAEYQVPRLVKETGKSEEEIQKIIDKATTGKLLGIFGEKTVNVLKVNLMLDGILEY